jgi:hypothetical protein
LLFEPPRATERERELGQSRVGCPFSCPVRSRDSVSPQSRKCYGTNKKEKLSIFLTGGKKKERKHYLTLISRRKNKKTKEFFAPEKWTWACDVSSYNFLAGHEETLHRNLFLVVVVVFSTASEKPSRLDYRRALGPQVGDNFRFHFISSFLIIFVGWEPNPRVGVVETRSEIYM